MASCNDPPHDVLHFVQRFWWDKNQGNLENLLKNKMSMVRYFREKIKFCFWKSMFQKRCRKRILIEISRNFRNPMCCKKVKILKKLRVDRLVFKGDSHNFHWFSFLLEPCNHLVASQNKDKHFFSSKIEAFQKFRKHICWFGS